MTSTLPSPTARPPATAPRSAGEPTTPATAPSPTPAPGASPAHLLLTELALWALTLTAIFGFCRIFQGGGFFAPLATVATIGHLTAALCRRRRMGVLVSFAVSAVVWLFVATWLFFVETTYALVPTPDTFATAQDELERSWHAFREIVAPAPALPGFLVAAAAAVGVGCFLADWAAFRLWSAREAVVPSLTLFVFATLLADDRHRVLCAVLEVGAALLFVLLHRIVTLERSDQWVDGGRTRAGWRLLRAGLALGVVAVVGGTLLAPALPGVDEEALVDWRRRSNEGGARTLTNPLVDVRKRLVDTSSELLFTVESPVESYWRIAGLNRFDGTTWDLVATTDQDADGALEVDPPARDTEPERVQQRITLEGLRTEWLPAAQQVVAFRPQGSPSARFDRETSTLIGSEQYGDGATYEVTSVITRPEPEQLRRARTVIDDELDDFLELPDDFSPTARALAEEVAGSARTPYDAALALEDWFQDSGGFTYDTDLVEGSTGNPVDDFLETRVGYCEQFAGTFAAMARSLGIPARVAVGYTWGEPDPTRPDRFRVLGRNAHAWPEVHLGQYGWVAFEPTPGRGNPSAQSYSDQPESQESPTDPEATTTTTAAEDTATTSTTLLPELEDAAPSASALDDSSADSVIGTAFLLAVALVALAGLYLLAVPGTLALRRRRRRSRAAGSPSAHVGAAWTDAVESLASVGVAARADETHAELARRAATAVPAGAAALDGLALLADAAAYGPPATEPDGVAADALARQVELAVDEALGTRGRLRRFLDPRPLWSRRRRRHRTS